MAVMTGFNPLPGSYSGYYINGPPVAGTSAVQTLTIGATSGSVTLLYEGSRSTPIAWNANAAAIQAALVALNSIGAGNVTVTAIGPFTISFAAVLGLRAVSLIGVDNSAAVGGIATVAMTTPGVAASGRGAATGAELVDVVGANIYLNAGTPLAPNWRLVTRA